MEFLATLEMDTSAFDLSVNLSTDLTVLPPAEEAEVKTFASDVASSYSIAVADDLNVNLEDLEVTCFYRMSDPAMLDLLTLSTTCSARRKLSELQALEASAGTRTQRHSFSVGITMVGEAAKAVTLRGTAAVAAELGAADVEIRKGEVVVTALVAAVGFPLCFF